MVFNVEKIVCKFGISSSRKNWWEVVERGRSALLWEPRWLLLFLQLLKDFMFPVWAAGVGVISGFLNVLLSVARFSLLGRKLWVSSFYKEWHTCGPEQGKGREAVTFNRARPFRGMGCIWWESQDWSIWGWIFKAGSQQAFLIPGSVFLPDACSWHPMAWP